MSKPEEQIIPSKGSRLFIDVGNSSIKAAFTKDGVWKQPQKSRIQKASDLLGWINRYAERFELIVITSVVDNITEALVRGLHTDRYRLLTAQDIPSDLLDYETPESLGLDRFFGCYGAVTHTRKPVVVIDAGSACTVDFMTSDYMYSGGVIIPGLTITEKSIKEYLPALPVVQRRLPDNWPGKNTKESLQWGITGSFMFALSSLLEKYESERGPFELVLTGGDAKLISELLDHEIKVRPLLVFEGMKQFLKDYL